MACATCCSSIIFCGMKHGYRKCCNKNIYQQDKIERFADTVPETDVEEIAMVVKCLSYLLCGANDGLNVLKSYFVDSLLILTKWKAGQKIKYLIGSLFFGWWGMSFGSVGRLFVGIREKCDHISSHYHWRYRQAMQENANMLIAQQILFTHASWGG